MLADLYEPLGSPLQGGGRWFEPSIAHLEKRRFAGETSKRREGQEMSLVPSTSPLMEVGRPPRCKGPGCNRIIRIGKYAPGDRELAEASRDKGDRPRRYKFRKDKEYCSDNCRVKAHYYEVVKPRKLKRAAKS